MDFLDFDDHALYFDEPLTPGQEALLVQAADAYPGQEAEVLLDNLYRQNPDSLTVLVACYRYYYYQHRYEDALRIAEQAIRVSAKSLGLKVGWEALSEQHLGQGVFVSMGLIRFYMLALKGSAYLLMRLKRIEEALLRLKKIVELDPADQFGARYLYEMAAKEQVNLQVAGYSNIESLFRR
jgi:tetratricopeptide (TPR) repeat protein